MAESGRCIPPDDLDDVILGRMVKEAGVFYKMELGRENGIGSLPEDVNFGIKASTVRQFLVSSGLPSKKAERTEEKSTEQLAEIAKNQALMVMCLH